MSDTGKKDSGLSLRQTEALFGAEGMNAAQQGAELLRRGKRIDRLEAEVGRLHKTLEHLSNESNYVFDEEGVYYALRRPSRCLLSGSIQLVYAWAFAKAALGQVEERE